LPHASEFPSTGAPKVVRHCVDPVRSSSAYTELRSVATMTRPRTTIGSAYTSPSSAPLVHATSTAVNDPAAPWPSRAGSRWYAGQSVSVFGVGLAGAVAPAVAAAVVGVTGIEGLPVNAPGEVQPETSPVNS